MVIYMIIYAIMTLGTFACILAMRREEGPVENINDLAGLAKNDLTMAFLLSMLMFSLAGIPPLAGFFGKYYVLLAAIDANLDPLAIIGVLASVIGAYYYLRIIKIMFFDEAAETFVPMHASLRAVLLASGLLVIGFLAYLGPLEAIASGRCQIIVQIGWQSKTLSCHKAISISGLMKSIQPIWKLFAKETMA